MAIKFVALALVFVAVEAQNRVMYVPQTAPQQRYMVARQPAYAPAPVPVPAYPASAPVYGYVPPSPIAPTCPAGFICCGNVKHFNPDNTKVCCGVQAYVPLHQTCSGGQVVSVIQSNPPPAPPPPPSYIQKVELVCEGIKWQVPYPNYQCCGPSVYNVQTENCPTPVSAPAPAQAPRQPTVATSTGTALLTCQGHRYEVPREDYQFYACCAHQPYFWVREQCIHGQISPQRPSTTTTSATPQSVPVLIVCDGTQHWVASTMRQHYGCCGASIYDTRVDSCQRPFNPSSPVSSGTYQCPAAYICCQNYPPVADPEGKFECCPSVGPYDPFVANCPTIGRGPNGKKKK